MPLRVSDKVLDIDAAMASYEVVQSHYKGTRRYHMMWRIVSVTGGRPNLGVAQNRRLLLKKPNPFRVKCYYIDFDGRYFLPTLHTFNILPFDGEKDIVSLGFFPTRFLDPSRNTLTSHIDKGGLIFDNIATAFIHYYYSGPVLTNQPCGCEFDASLHQEHIESEVIVDFRMTLARNPTWRPKFVMWNTLEADQHELHERKQVQYWNGSATKQLLYSDRDIVHDDSQIDLERAYAFKNSEEIFQPIPSAWLSSESVIPEKDAALLPGRVFAYVLRNRANLVSALSPLPVPSLSYPKKEKS